MSSPRVLEQFENAYSIADFAAFTADCLSRYGFSPANSLSLVGLCRDELMFPTEQALNATWGSAFDMSSLGAMVFLGRSGLAAATHHAPGADGRNRFVNIVMPHIGIDATGDVGKVMRSGQSEASTACGALAGLLGSLRAGEAPTTELDWGDLEMSLLRQVLGARPEVENLHALELWDLTQIAREVATAEILRLSHEQLESDHADVAVFSAIMIHGPSEDRVALQEGSLWLASDSQRISL